MDGVSSGSERDCELKGDRLDNDGVVTIYDRLHFESETRRCFTNCEASSAVASAGVINADSTPADSQDTWDGLDLSEKHYCLRRQNALDYDQGNGTASVTDSDSETKKVDQKWGADVVNVHKINTVKSQRPNLSSKGNTVQTTVDSCDIVAETISNSTCSSGSKGSLVSDDSEYKIRKRKHKVLRINKGRTNFTEIETVKYTFKSANRKEHYVTTLRHATKEVWGDTGLRSKDLLLKIDGKSLENIQQREVVKIFKKIKPSKGDEKIYITLVVRRWEREDIRLEEMETDYEFQLILEPELGDQAEKMSKDICNHRKQKNRHRSFRASVKKQTIQRQRPVPPGLVDNISFEDEVTGRLKVLGAGPDVFMTAGEEGNVLVVVPTEENREDSVFKLRKLGGRDISPDPMSEFIYMGRISPLAAGPNIYLMSCIRNNENNLRFKESSVVDTSGGLDGAMDESVFILRESGDIILFESLLFRDHYISVRKDTDGTTSLQMVRKSDDDVLSDTNVDECRFNFFVTDRDERLGHENSESFLKRILNHILSCVGNWSSHEQRIGVLLRPIL